MSTPRRSAGIALLALALSACTSGGDMESDPDKAPEVKTDVGVGSDEITLGILADQSGAGSELSTGVSRGGELWAAEVNAAGGICGREVVIDTQDSAGDPTTATAAYQAQQGNVLGYLQVGGAAVSAALSPTLESDGLLAITEAPTSTGLGSPNLMTLGPTYDVQAINGLAWLNEQDQLPDDAVIGHLHNDAEYGQNAALGVAAYADQHDLPVVDAPVAASETDMATAMTSLQEQGVTAVVLSLSPQATASAAVQNKALGLDVPLIAGSESFTPASLADVTSTAAFTQVSFVQGFAPLSASVAAASDLSGAYADEYGDDPAPGVVAGYVAGQTWRQILESACEAGDLTRAGVLKAREGISDVDSSTLSVALDLSNPDEPTSRESVIVRTAPEEAGKLVLAEAPFVADEATSYQTP